MSYGFNEAAGIPRGRRTSPWREDLYGRASMRPRVFPAEDAGAGAEGHQGHRASMRPRVFPAEDPAGGLLGVPVRAASMRPRVFPAEDVSV